MPLSQSVHDDAQTRVSEVLPLTMQRGQVLRLCKPRRKPRPPDAVALEEALWAEHADIVDPGTLSVLLALSGTATGKVLGSFQLLGPAMHTDSMRRACAFVDQIARPMLGEMYVAQQVRDEFCDSAQHAVSLGNHDPAPRLGPSSGHPEAGAGTAGLGEPAGRG